MCQAAPGKVIEILTQSLPRRGRVDFQGLIREVSLDCLPEVQVGDYVIVHAGFAINRLDQAEAERTLAVYREWNQHD